MATRNDNPTVRALASRLRNEPLMQRYYPYASLGSLKISRNTEYPWDDEGLPWIYANYGAPEDGYCLIDPAQENVAIDDVALDGRQDSEPSEGNIETVVGQFLALVALRSKE